MAILKRFDLARQYCSTVGTGPLVLGAAVPGYMTYADAGAVDGDLVAYTAREGVNGETGSGIYSSTGPQITRNVRRSTNGGAPIDLTGSAEVFSGVQALDFGILANQALLLDDAGKIPDSGSILTNVRRRGVLVSKNAAYAITAADRDAVLLVDGSFTLSHAISAADAGNGFRYTVRNIGSATITLDPAGSETIDSATTLQCLAKQQFDVVCDGASWWTVGRQQIVVLEVQDITTPTAGVSLIFPPDYLDFEITISHWIASGSNSVMYFQFSGLATGYYFQQIYSNVATLGGSFGNNLANVPIISFGLANTQRARGKIFIFPGISGQPASWYSDMGAVASGDGSNYQTIMTGYAGAGRQSGIGFVAQGGATTAGRFVLTGRCK
jgi:hypothetical protein